MGRLPELKISKILGTNEKSTGTILLKDEPGVDVKTSDDSKDISILNDEQRLAKLKNSKVDNNHSVVTI